VLGLPSQTRNSPRARASQGCGGCCERCRGGYRSDAVNFAHTPAVNARVPPSRSVVSRTRIEPSSLAVSTHASPPFPLKLGLRQLPACFPMP
jgi:hypothetical protein